MSDEILDAARDVFEEFGARRANVDDVARKAGISRSTLYRRFPNKETLLAAVIDRETNAFLDELDRIAQDLPLQEAIIECFVHGMAIMREIPVLGRLAKTEPEMISGIPGRAPALLEHSDRIARTLRRAGARMPDEELLVVAELMLRLASTFLLDPGGRLDMNDPEAVRDYAKRYLSQLVE